MITHCCPIVRRKRRRPRYQARTPACFSKNPVPFQFHPHLLRHITYFYSKPEGPSEPPRVFHPCPPKPTALAEAIKGGNSRVSTSTFIAFAHLTPSFPSCNLPSTAHRLRLTPSRTPIPTCMLYPQFSPLSSKSPFHSDISFIALDVLDKLITSNMADSSSSDSSPATKNIQAQMVSSCERYHPTNRAANPRLSFKSYVRSIKSNSTKVGGVHVRSTNSQFNRTHRRRFAEARPAYRNVRPHPQTFGRKVVRSIIDIGRIRGELVGDIQVQRMDPDEAPPLGRAEVHRREFKIHCVRLARFASVMSPGVVDPGHVSVSFPLN
jgi:hypothetical protein